MLVAPPQKEQAMSSSNFQVQHPTPWNKGKLVGPKPPLKLKEVWAIRIRLQLAGRTRDVALFNPGATGVSIVPERRRTTSSSACSMCCSGASCEP
jgi:hypothetical protein